jgi:hypothetical protein
VDIGSEGLSPKNNGSIGRSALVLLLIAPLVGVVWWFTPSDPPPQSIGRTEERLRSQAADLYAGVATREAVASCQYWAKHLYLTCELPRELAPSLHQQLLSAGWTAEAGSFAASAKNAYRKERDSSTLQCKDASGSRCTLSLFAPR